jgi:hypothetical protein
MLITFPNSKDYTNLPVKFGLCCPKNNEIRANLDCKISALFLCIFLKTAPQLSYYWKTGPRLLVFVIGPSLDTCKSPDSHVTCLSNYFQGNASPKSFYPRKKIMSFMKKLKILLNLLFCIMLFKNWLTSSNMSYRVKCEMCVRIFGPMTAILERKCAPRVCHLYASRSKITFSIFCKSHILCINILRKGNFSQTCWSIFGDVVETIDHSLYFLTRFPCTCCVNEKKQKFPETLFFPFYYLRIC